jgi:hypothetical protein
MPLSSPVTPVEFESRVAVCPGPLLTFGRGAAVRIGAVTAPVVAATEPDDEEEELGDEEDLSVAQPASDEDSAFDDFDDEFDDDFEEEEDDPDWDHPDDGEGDVPPAGKNPGRKK